MVVFVGAPLQANVEAARFIAGDLAAALPDCLFMVVGLPASSVGGSLRENVTFTGRLPDRHKEAAFALADAAVCPLVEGSGSSLKIPDFAAHGKPVVSTRVGARGFPQLEPHVRLSERDAFAGALSDVLVRLRRDPAALDADAAAARALVEKELDWDVLAAPLAEALCRLG